MVERSIKSTPTRRGSATYTLTTINPPQNDEELDTQIFMLE